MTRLVLVVWLLSPVWLVGMGWLVERTGRSDSAC